MTDSRGERFRAPLDQYRASVLWKADVYATEAEYQESKNDVLSLEQVADIFNADLAERGIPLTLTAESIVEQENITALGTHYPEDIPMDAGISIFDAM